MTVQNANLKFTSKLTPLILAGIKYIVVHHTASLTASPQQIHEWHLNNGWAGAGYNEYIRKNGSVWIMRGDNVGAHCSGYNTTGYGICCEGNFDVETAMSTVQFDALAERIKFHAARFKTAQIVRHSDLGATACPGRHFPWNNLIVSKSQPPIQTTPDPEDTPNAETVNPVPANLYRVRKTWDNPASQLGAYAHLSNAIAIAIEHPAYMVFDSFGNVAFEPPSFATAPEKCWQQTAYDYLQNMGVPIDEKRFNDHMTRGEVFALLEKYDRARISHF